jgi:hypothetical protein
MKYLGLAEGLLFCYGPMTKPLRGRAANTRTVCSTPNTIFLLLLTPGNEQLPTQIPGLCLIEFSLGKRSFVRGITPVHFILMIVKQVNAPVTFFQDIPVSKLDKPNDYLLCNLFYNAFTKSDHIKSCE